MGIELRSCAAQGRGLRRGAARRGFDAAQLQAAGFLLAQLKAAGFDAEQLRAAGFLAQFMAAGFDAEQLRAAGYSSWRLRPWASTRNSSRPRASD